MGKVANFVAGEVMERAAMTVREIFELRRQGRVEEAYAAIRPLYAVHKGRYTTLCMFWTASDVLGKRMRERHHVEAEQIFRALLRVLPGVDDADGKALAVLLRHAVRLAACVDSFRLLDVASGLTEEQLMRGEWRPVAMPTSAGGGMRLVPSAFRQMLDGVLRELQSAPTVDNALKAVPLLRVAVCRLPGDATVRRCVSVIHGIMEDGRRSQYTATLRPPVM